jgi:hypothetical protein
MRSAVLSAAQCRCRRTPDHGFASTTEGFVDEHLSGAARRTVSGVGDLWGGEERTGARGSPSPQAADRREAMRRRRVQRRCERHRSRPRDGSTAAKSACKADRPSRSPHRIPPVAPRNGLKCPLEFHFSRRRCRVLSTAPRRTEDRRMRRRSGRSSTAATRRPARRPASARRCCARRGERRLAATPACGH